MCLGRKKKKKKQDSKQKAKPSSLNNTSRALSRKE
jgi:hypothetical protein